MTLKIKYECDNNELISLYCSQYTSCLHVIYNHLLDLYKQDKFPTLFSCYSNASSCSNLLNSLNNVDLIKDTEWFRHCVINEAYSLVQKFKEKKIIFGGKKNFLDRCKNKISNKEFKELRMHSLYSIGTAKPYKGNQKFEILNDCETVLFKPNRKTHIHLKLIGIGNNRKKILSQLFLKQNTKTYPITYKLSKDYILIFFDESKLFEIKNEVIHNRIFSIDMNPNYIGWSVADWKSSNECSIIKTGVISIKRLNDKQFNLKESSNSNSNKKLNNKRKHEIFQISKYLIDKCLHYKCSLFAIEDLHIKQGNKEHGKKFNRLVNNVWNRNLLVNNLQKRCNIFNIKLLKVKPEYSSFIGNIIFRNENKPDMVLASIEISRRAYEFYNQYVIKSKNIEKNIIQPSINKFAKSVVKSLEEFNITQEFKDFVELYNFFKNSKLLYRVPLDICKINNYENRKVFRKSDIEYIIY